MSNQLFSDEASFGALDNDVLGKHANIVQERKDDAPAYLLLDFRQVC